MNTAEFLALLEAAGLPKGLPLREVDEWVAKRLKISDRTARQWRLTGKVPFVARVALENARSRT